MGTRLKWCSKCQTEHSVDQFNKDNSRKDGLCCSCRKSAKEYYDENQAKIRLSKMAYYEQNRDKVNAQRRGYREGNREKLALQWKKRADKMRDSRLQRLYGISYEDKIKMHEQQDGKCALCHQLLDVDNLHVDHDHNNGKVRGLLCIHCNMGLGKFKENIAVLESAVNYIKQGGA